MKSVGEISSREIDESAKGRRFDFSGGFELAVEADIEILELAIAREVEAHHFLMAIAERVASKAIRRVFEELAAEELEHKSTLELEMLKLGHTVPLDQELPEPSGSYIISNTDAPLDMDYRDVLLLGIEKEEASFRTYVNLIGHVSNEESKEMLLSLAEEEVKHKLRFETELERLEKKDPT